MLARRSRTSPRTHCLLLLCGAAATDRSMGRFVIEKPRHPRSERRDEPRGPGGAAGGRQRRRLFDLRDNRPTPAESRCGHPSLRRLRSGVSEAINLSPRVWRGSQYSFPGPFPKRADCPTGCGRNPAGWSLKRRSFLPGRLCHTTGEQSNLSGIIAFARNHRICSE
jgi:hypothetical protein